MLVMLNISLSVIRVVFPGSSSPKVSCHVISAGLTESGPVAEQTKSILVSGGTGSGRPVSEASGVTM